MTEKRLIESTISFQFNEQAYEAARQSPTLYKALKQEPRKEHPFHIYEAILRQPELVAETIRTFPEIAQRMARELTMRKIRHILFTGIGASYHVGFSATHAIWRLCGLTAESTNSSEALLSGQVYYPDETAVIGLSASGNSLETVRHLEAARESGAYTLAFTNLDNTRLTNCAHDSYVAPGGYGLIWDYTTRLTALVILAIELGKQSNQNSRDLEAIETALADLPNQMQMALESINTRCQELGSEIQPLRAIVLPAAGNQLPTAWETALRFEEMAHFPAGGKPIVDFLHGGVGLLAPDILTLLFASPGNSYEYSLRAAKVTRIVKSPCIAVVDIEDKDGVAEFADGVLRIPTSHPLIAPLLSVLPGQLLPYYTEVARSGGNPDVQHTDQPRYARAFDIAMPPKSH